MTLPQLSKALTSIYNTLGNKWITENLKSDPFEFRVYVRKGDDSDLQNIIVEVFTDRPIPQTLPYINPDEHHGFDGIHYSFLINKFKEFADYVDRFGDLGRTLGVKFMDLEN